MSNMNNKFQVKLLALLIASSLYPVVVQAQESKISTVNTENENKVQALSAIIVTGTRKVNRSATQSSQPIDVVTTEELQKRTGTSELGTALSKLIPSINFPRPSVADGTEFVRPAQLKGLSPDQVLVLVNGKRRHTSAFINMGGTIGRGSSPTDLNAIPMSAVSRIEVLKDGASARYGSDAIAGVINIILKTDTNHGDVGVRYGKYSAGDGEQKQTYVSGGTSLNGKGFVTFAGELEGDESTNRAGLDRRNPLSNTYGQRNFRYGDPKQESVKIALNSEYDLTDHATLYSFATYSRKDAESAAFYRLDTSFANTEKGNNLKKMYPKGFLPLIFGQSEDVAGVFGIKGDLNDWRYDLSADFGRNKYQVRTDTINVSTYNDFNYTPTRFYNGALINDQTVVNLDLSRDFDVNGLSGPLTFSTGVQYLNQNYQIKAGDPNSYYKTGSSGLAGFRDADAGKWSRDNLAAYLDVDAIITDKLSGSLAYRHEYYNDFGHTNNGALSLRYALNPMIAFRGNFSSGFRVPSLAQSNYTQTSSQLINQSIVEAGTFSTTSKVARLLGAEDLRPETSRDYSLGFVLTPTDNFYLTFDAYLIDIKNRISLSSNIDASKPAAQEYLVAHGIRDINFQTVRFFNNAADTRTKGLDLVANYAWNNLPYGQLNTSLAYNYNENKVTKIRANPAILDVLGGKRIDRREQYGILADSTPKQKLSITNDYTLGHWGISTNVTRYGSFKSYNSTNPSLDQKYSAKWLLDLALSYKTDHWKFEIGGDNITNVYPDKDRDTKGSGGSIQYSLFSPFGANGAFYYTRINYHW
ncbi:TonB-dependent receptor [Acinetobacter sp. B10A]|uniref:TonB-dependent receptor plug domain-containing protein n=1 Tax=Acinetobacter baretiae TaxID=2605383 RepID=UPI001B3C5E53|nr:TonB-dependent receptor [Acinetobacter baretiae]MBF7685289.1 TonB-dependent receptor [Acinetobacter baretiae]